jgi:hypothetical protein
VLSKYSYTDYFKKGAYVDAQDTTATWMVAKILRTDGTNMEINFDGWSEKWNIVSKNINLSLVCIDP